MARSELEILIDIQSKLGGIHESARAMSGLDKKSHKTFQRIKDGAKGAYRWMNRLAVVGIAGVTAGLTAAAKASIDYGSTMSDIATRNQMGIEEFQALNDVAREAGVGQEVLERGIRNSIGRLQEAADGNRRYADAVNRLGLDLGALMKLPVERRLEAFGQAFVNATNKSEAFRDIQAILGERAGPMLLEVLEKLGTQGYDVLAEKARETGNVMADSTARSLDRAADAIEAFKTRATIKVGEIIAGESDGAAAKIFGLQLLKAASKFAEFIVKIPVRFGVLLKSVLLEAGSQLGSRFDLIGQTLKVNLMAAVNAVFQRIPGISDELKDAFSSAVNANEKLLEAMGRKVERETPGFFEGVGNRYSDDMEAVDQFFKDSPIFGGTQGTIDDTIEALRGELRSFQEADKAKNELENLRVEIDRQGEGATTPATDESTSLNEAAEELKTAASDLQSSAKEQSDFERLKNTPGARTDRFRHSDGTLGERVFIGGSFAADSFGNVNPRFRENPSGIGARLAEGMNATRDRIAGIDSTAPESSGGESGSQNATGMPKTAKALTDLKAVIEQADTENAAKVAELGQALEQKGQENKAAHDRIIEIVKNQRN
ncbi:MAG: hypothetical protein AAGJ81_14745 [Verrucomicrobiota bacterium]